MALPGNVRIRFIQMGTASRPDQEEKVSLKIKPAHVTLIGNAHLGTRNNYHMARAFYKIFHLLLHARLALLHQQPCEQFSYLPVSFRLQVLEQCKRKHKSPLCQSHSIDTLKSFSSKCHRGTWIVQPVCVNRRLTFKMNKWHPCLTSGKHF